MDKKNEETIDGLRHLLSICNDGKEGYKHAAENADTGELKALFTTYSIQRAEFADKLKTCLREQGGDPDNETGGPLGILHRTWIDIKTAITTNDNKAVLDACITGEKAAVEAYDKVLEDENINADIRQIVMQQRSQIAEALQHIQRLELQYAS
jgi:uncharacterized protein (TIGR02284 family)